MYTRFHFSGFITFGMIQVLGLYGIISTNAFGIFLWYYEPVAENRIIRLIPLQPFGTFVFLVVNTMGYIAVASHYRCAVTDPGVITDQIQPPKIMPQSEIALCQRCEIPWKPMRAHHCSVGKACIFKMDHHCPWTNNGIGLKNMKYFFLFLLYSAVGGLIALCLLINASYKYYYDTITDYSQIEYFHFKFGLFLFTAFGSIGFLVISGFMAHGQLEAFQDNQTYVEDIKELVGKPYYLFEGLKAYIGQDWYWWWAPTRPVLYIDYCERIYTMDEVVSKAFKNYKNYEYDPQNKTKAKEWKDSMKDKVYFIILTLILGSISYLFLI